MAERRLFENVAQAFAVGLTGQEYLIEGDFLLRSDDGLENLGHWGRLRSYVKDGEIYLRATGTDGDAPWLFRLNKGSAPGERANELLGSVPPFKVIDGVHIDERHNRVGHVNARSPDVEPKDASDSDITWATRTMVATRGAIVREGQDDYVTFGWWYAMRGQIFVKEAGELFAGAPDYGKPEMVMMRAFADGPEFNRAPETLPTGVARYEGPAIGFRTVRDLKSCLSPFGSGPPCGVHRQPRTAITDLSGTASLLFHYGLGRGGHQGSTQISGNISLGGKTVFSVAEQPNSLVSGIRSGQYKVHLEVGAKGQIIGSWGGRSDDGKARVDGYLSSVLEDGFPRGIIGVFHRQEEPLDERFVEEYRGSFHAPLVMD